MPDPSLSILRDWQAQQEGFSHWVWLAIPLAYLIAMLETWWRLRR